MLSLEQCALRMSSLSGACIAYFCALGWKSKFCRLCKFCASLAENYTKGEGEKLKGFPEVGGMQICI